MAHFPPHSGFALHKRAFQDTLALRYNWQPLQAPSACACVTKFSIEHALSCPKGGFPSIRHNEIKDVTANLLTEVCNDEPELLPIDGEVFTGASSYTQDGARLDIAANGFLGGRFERTFIDVRVFNPHAPSNRQPTYFFPSSISYSVYQGCSLQLWTHSTNEPGHI